MLLVGEALNNRLQGRLSSLPNTMLATVVFEVSRIKVL
jgi:hypothetical protein